MSGDNNGAVIVIYKKESGGFRYLLPTQKNGMINFIGGGREEEDQTDEDNIRREISEETSLNRDDLDIQNTGIYHRFVYNSGNKPLREGKSWQNIVFVARVNSSLIIKPSSELKSLGWYAEDEAIRALSFEDMKDVFKEVVCIIKSTEGDL